MSNSPHLGHMCWESSPYIQSAGHVPHPVGMWLSVKTKRPELYTAFDVMRTERRPPKVTLCESAPR